MSAFSTSETREQDRNGDLEKVRELARRQEALNRQQQELAKQELSEEEKKREVEKLTREQSELRRQAEELARQIAGHAPLTMRSTKELLRRLRRHGPGVDDKDVVAKVYTSADFREGLDAFLSKRPPQWTGR